MQRFGQVIRVKPESIAAYEELHAHPWPEVIAQLAALHIHNYSIFRHEQWLFAYFEYHGNDYVAEMQADQQTAISQAWHTLTDAMQDPLLTRAEGEWWASMREIFYAP